MATGKLRQALAAKQHELRLLQIEEKSITKMEKDIRLQLRRLNVEEMAFNSIALDSEVRDVKGTGNDTGSNKTLSFTNILASREVSSQVTEQLQPRANASVDADALELPNLVNKTDLNLIVPHSLGMSHHSISDEEMSEDEEENECLLEL